jgi:hypothetical protein
MTLDFAGCVVAMIFDSKQITGVNAWLKPAKFGFSSAVTCFTLALIVGHLKSWPKIRVWASRIFSASIAIEILVIDTQAARGTTSHFNMTTLFDRATFILMGISICTLWFSMAAMTGGLVLQEVKPRSWAWSLRLGLLLSLVGAAGGGLMLRQTPEQTRTVGSNHFGSHTVGAPDGGPGLPIANWSTRHGDLRVPHFLGLHAVQILPLMGWWLLGKRRFTEQQRTGLVWLASGVYFLAYVLFTWQALRGQPLLQPDGATLAAALGIALFAGTGTIIVMVNSMRAAIFQSARTLEVEE